MQTSQTYGGYSIAFDRGRYRATPLDEEDSSIEIIAEDFDEVCCYIDQLWAALDQDAEDMPGWIQTWLVINQKKIYPASTGVFLSMLDVLDIVIDDSSGEVAKENQ